MSYFSKNSRLEKTIVVFYFHKKYFKAKGLAMKLANDVAYRLMEGMREREGSQRAEKKYGVPYVGNSVGALKWRENRKRLRGKAFRRLLPVCKRVFEEK